MNNDLLKYIGEYFNTFNHKDYTIYVNERPALWWNVNGNKVVYHILPPPDLVAAREWFDIKEEEIEEVSMTVTTMTIKKKNGKEYMFIAKVKAKEEKAKNLILKVKNVLYAHKIDAALGYLDELNALMDAQ